MFPLAFVAGSLQGHWWGFISRNYVVWPIFFLMNVFIALKGTHFWILLEGKLISLFCFSPLSFTDVYISKTTKKKNDSFSIYRIYSNKCPLSDKRPPPTFFIEKDGQMQHQILSSPWNRGKFVHIICLKNIIFRTFKMQQLPPPPPPSPTDPPPQVFIRINFYLYRF